MNELEQVREALCAVRDEIDAILITGPLISSEEAFSVGTLMRLTAPRVLRFAENEPAKADTTVRNDERRRS